MKLSSSPSFRLTELRAELDALDDQIHDLLMRRAKLVEDVAAEGGKTGAKIRPGREAVILRRLLARHEGAMPRQAIVRFWRELFSAALIIEGGQTMAVCDGEGGEARLALAREHFGPLTPARRHHNAAQTLADVRREGGAQLAVLPPPGEDEEGREGWWPMLISGPARLYVIARIPFWTKRAEGLPQGEAYVVANVPPDESGNDRGLIALAASADVSRGRLAAHLREAGFEPGQMWVRRIPGSLQVSALIEVPGLVSPDDPRLGLIAGLEGPAAVIGGYAVPLGEQG